MGKFFSFTNYYFSIISIFLSIAPFAFNEKIGIVVSSFFILWHHFERKELKEQMAKAKTEFNESADKIKFIMYHVNFNIIDVLNWDSTDEIKFNEIVTENNDSFEQLFSHLNKMGDCMQTIQYLENNSGALFVSAPELSHMYRYYSLFAMSYIYDFQQKYKNIDSISYIKKYRDDWLELLVKMFD